ncbi:Uncharacterised protein [Raoultella ornithinolytica]|nr:Uncharacterised protein [Raoultella ornithinolytica]
MNTVVQRGWRKLHHLRKLAGSNKGAIGFRHHKGAIEGQAADIGKRVRQTNSTHGFDGMNKKSR